MEAVEEIPVLPSWTGAGTGHSSVLCHKESKPLQTPSLQMLLLCFPLSYASNILSPAPLQLTFAQLLPAA